MEKNGLRYSFEKIRGALVKYQVRLKGQFVMYTNHKDSALVDKELEEEGFTSREEVLDFLVKETLKNI